MLQNGELTDSPLRMVPTAHGASDAGGQRMTYEREYVLPRILEEASLVDQQEGREATLVDEAGQPYLLVRVLCARCARMRAGCTQSNELRATRRFSDVRHRRGLSDSLLCTCWDV